MARFEISDDFDKLNKNFDDLILSVPGACKKAVYQGAKTVADGMRESINQIGNCTEAERDGLLKGMGISKIDVSPDGDVSAAIGFDGYNEYKTKEYPKGHPNLMVARSINKGTSFRKADKFVNRAVKNSKEKAQKAMADVIDQAVEKNT
ncbi:MAG: hypothetical protein WCS21_05515 [Lachnospiraceae bacterium]